LSLDSGVVGKKGKKIIVAEGRKRKERKKGKGIIG